ncbi:hypothetical protein L7F22_030847 [Adiantum nelumboides]|nr:hypothetical protein [Adiantum nelumboides]
MSGSVCDSTLTSDGSSLEAETTGNSACMCRDFSDDTSMYHNVDLEVTCTDRKATAMDEKIHVTVRVRPLNSKEISSDHFSIWECPDDRTVACLYSRSDRSNFPQSYIFGKHLLLVPVSISVPFWVSGVLHESFVCSNKLVVGVCIRFIQHHVSFPT